MIYFTAANTDFLPGALFAIQSVAGLPALPAGRTQIGPGYALAASPGVSLPVGSVSFQYMSNDVLQAGVDPNDRNLSQILGLYFYGGGTWQALTTTVDVTFTEAVAPSQGAGLYALLASKAVALPKLGWNLIGYPLHNTQSVTEGLASITGKYTLVYGFDNTDGRDPWKVYAPGAPGYVNDLKELRDSQGYWIYAIMTTTLYLAPADLVQGPLPPATFYGVVSGSADFTPTEGMTVTAYINGTLCGVGSTQRDGGEVVYTVDVEGDNNGVLPGCGQTGKGATLYVADQRMGPVGQWDNTRLAELNLTPNNQPEQYVYLPLVRR
jgi:hypothetical protein